LDAYQSWKATWKSKDWMDVLVSKLESNMEIKRLDGCVIVSKLQATWKCAK
jgi:hypothetical protein